MKKLYYLTSILLVLLIASCKKTEYFDKKIEDAKLSIHQLAKQSNENQNNEPSLLYKFSNYNGATGTIHVSLKDSQGQSFSDARIYLNNSSTGGLQTIGVGKNIPYEFDIVLPIGTWTFQMASGDAYRESVSFTVKDKPFQAPSGFLNLYRYYNKFSNRHYYSTNWNTLGSNGENYHFEKVQGLIYETAGSNRLALYEYYNPVTDDHWYTTNSSGWPGYNLFGTIGYISTIQSAEASLPLDEYFSGSSGHIYSSPPEVMHPSLTLNEVVGYITPFSSSLQAYPIHLFFHAAGGDHFTSPDRYATVGFTGWSYYGSEFKAYLSQAAGTVPVYEFYYNNNHYNSTNRTAIAGIPGWTNHGIKFYAYSTYQPGTIPIYLYYHAVTHDHYITPNPNISTNFPGWSNFGVAFYAFPN